MKQSFKWLSCTPQQISTSIFAQSKERIVARTGEKFREGSMASTQTGETPKELPHNHEAILEMAELHSAADLHEHFRTGVFLNNKTMRYWTQPSTHFNSFMLYSRALTITGSKDPNYWRWLWLEGDMDVEVAELLTSVPVEVKGSFEMNHFTPGAKYEVMFAILMLDHSGDAPHATMKIKLPNGESQEKHLSLEAMAAKQWAEVKAGEFVASGEGNIEFSLDVTWKEGLIIEGVLIEPCP